MKYKNYTAKVVFDAEARIFHGEVLGLRDVITFQSHRADRLEREFRKSVDEYLAFCRKVGRAPEKPYSGRFVLRVAPELHRRLATMAAVEDKGLNEFIVEKLEQATGQESA